MPVFNPDENSIINVEVFTQEPPFGGVMVETPGAVTQLEINTGSPVSSVFGRIGEVVANCDDYALCYAPLSAGLPSGGLPGQTLAKLSGESLDVGWTNAGAGSVTNFSAGDLAPLFTTGVADPSSTPALSFNLSDAGAHCFLGNNTAGSAPPAYVQPAFTDLSGSLAIGQIGNNLITYAKLQQASAESILIGRGQGAGAGNLQEITLGSGLSMVGTVLSSTGGGNVSNSGSPLLDQTAVWVDATHIKGVTSLKGGSTSQVLQKVSNTDFDWQWATLSFGNVSNSGTPTAGQIGVWVTATTIQGKTTLAGGSGSQVLTKNSATDYDYAWVTPGVGGNVSTSGTITAGQLAEWTDATHIRSDTPAQARTAIGATTLGGNLITATNVAAISFIRINADNSITLQSAANFRTDISAAGSGAIGSSGLTMNTARLLGRTTAAAGAIEEISVSAELTLSATTLGITTAGVTRGMLANATALSVIGRSANSSGVPADIAATAASGAVLRESGSTIGWGTIASAGIGNSQVTYAKIQNVAASSLLGNPTGSPAAPSEITLVSPLAFSTTTLQINTNGISNTLLRQGTALSVIGRNANSLGNVADIAATATSDAVLRESGSTLGFGTIATGGIANNAVTYAKMQQASAASILIGRGAGAGAGDLQEITLGTNLSMTGTVLNATGGGGGNVSNSGTPTTDQLPIWTDATHIKGVTGLTGGSLGQVLKKNSATDYDWSWGAVTAGAAGSDKQVQFNDGGTNLGADADFTWDKTSNLLTLTNALPASTVGDSLLLINDTAATLGNPRYSPDLRFRGHNWDTNSGADKTSDYRIFNATVSGYNAYSTLNFDYQSGAGGYTNLMSLSSYNGGSLILNFNGAGNSVALSFASNSAGFWNGSRGVTAAVSNTSSIAFGTTSVGLGATVEMGWTGTSGDPNGTIDVGLARNASGILEINNGTAGQFADILTRGLRSNEVTYANRIASPVVGTLQAFSDSNTNTQGATIAGGGSNHVMGFYNGTNWIVATGAGGGGGNVTTAATLTSGRVILGNGGVDVTVDAGINYSASQLILGISPTAAGSMKLLSDGGGSVVFAVPSIAGNITFTPPTATTNLSSTGGTGHVLKQATLGGAITSGTLSSSEVSPPASDKYVLYNDGGAWGGDINFQWDKTAKNLSLGASTVGGTLTLWGAGTALSSVKLQAPGSSAIMATFTFPLSTTDLSATGGTGHVLKQATLGGAITSGTLAASDVGLGNVTNDAQIKASDFPASSVDSEIALFSGTGGKSLKRATGSGLVTATSGVYGTVTAPSGTVVGTSDTQTLTNKRVTQRAVSQASSATWSPNGDTTDLFYIATAQATNVTTVNAPSGTPTDGQKLIFRIKCDATPRTITGWNAIYRFSSDMSAPADLVASKTLYLGFIYNSTDSKWDNVSQMNNF